MSLLEILLQVLLVASALTIVALYFRHGWKRGFGRQFFNLLALAAAYTVAVCGGELAPPVFRPLGYPDVVARLVVGLVMAAMVFFGIREIGRILLRERTRRGTPAASLSLTNYGGAALGGVFATLALWIAVIGLRLLGTVSETEMTRQAALPARELAPVAAGETTSRHVMSGLATLKHSIESGPTGAVVRRVDPVPLQLYSSLRKLAQLLAQPERADLFLSYPGAQELIGHPRLVALQRDPGITRALEQGNFFGLLRHPEVVAAANDRGLRELLGKFDLDHALDYALEEKADPALPAIGERR